MASHSRILAWEIPRTQKLGGLQSTGSQESDHDLSTSNKSIINSRRKSPVQCNYYWIQEKYIFSDIFHIFIIILTTEIVVRLSKLETCIY